VTRTNVDVQKFQCQIPDRTVFTWPGGWEAPSDPRRRIGPPFAPRDTGDAVIMRLRRFRRSEAMAKTDTRDTGPVGKPSVSYPTKPDDTAS